MKNRGSLPLSDRCRGLPTRAIGENGDLPMSAGVETPGAPALRPIEIAPAHDNAAGPPLSPRRSAPVECSNRQDDAHRAAGDPSCLTGLTCSGVEAETRGRLRRPGILLGLNRNEVDHARANAGKKPGTRSTRPGPNGAAEASLSRRSRRACCSSRGSRCSRSSSCRPCSRSRPGSWRSSSRRRSCK